LSDLTLFLKKKFWSALFTAFLFLSCSSTDLERNPYLAEYSFQFPINLNLPEYNDLKLAGGSVLISQLGHKGVIVYNINGNTFLAWEASCPNHAPSSCSQIQVSDFIAECSCEEYQYNLLTGQLLNPPADAETEYPLLFYRAEVRGNSVVVSN